MSAALVAAVLVVVGIPWLGMAWWATRRGGADPADRIGLSYGAVGLVAWGLWLTFSVLGPSVAAVLAGVALAAAAPVASFWLDPPSRPATGAGLRSVRSPGDDPTGARTLALLATVSCVLTLIPFFTYGRVGAAGVHRHALTDWYKHLVVTVALDASAAFPPDNPFVPAAGAAPYYYGFQLVASSIDRVAGFATDPWLALLALTLLNAAALPFVVCLFARDVCGRRASLFAAAAATLLTGFDLLVLALDAARQTVAAWPLAGGLAGLRSVVPSTHLDYWIHHNERQLNSPYVTNLWAPQHLTAVLIALIVLWMMAPRAPGHGPGATEREPHATGRDGGRPAAGSGGNAPARGGWILPALLLATLPALSAYVALGLALGVVGAIGVSALQERRSPWRLPICRRWLAPAALGALLALPITFAMVGRGGPSGRLILHVSGAGDWINGAVFSTLFGARWWTALLDTPAVLLLELGIVGILGGAAVIGGLRRADLSPAQRQAALVAVSVAGVVTFVRPPVDGPNNLYARPMVLVYCLLAAFAAPALVAARSRLRESWPARLVLTGVIVGGLGTAYATLGYVLESGLFWATPVDEVDAASWINEQTPIDARIAIHPTAYDPSFGWWLRRPLVLADERHALLFGATRQQYADTDARLRRAFAAATPEAAAAAFDALDADVVLLRADGGPGATWARPPCFEIAHSNPLWRVARRRPDACAGSGR